MLFLPVDLSFVSVCVSECRRGSSAGDFNTSPYRGVFQKKDASAAAASAYGLDNLRPVYRMLTQGDLPAHTMDKWYGREVQVNQDQWFAFFPLFFFSVENFFF
jgi:hypothetical protein